MPTGNTKSHFCKNGIPGTFAQVYLARAKDAGGLKRIVAVKVLKERWTESNDVLSRTRDEAQLLASLQHHNIVRVDAITEIDGRPAIIMEFVHGLDVAQLLNALGNRNEVIPAQGDLRNCRIHSKRTGCRLVQSTHRSCGTLAGGSPGHQALQCHDRCRWRIEGSGLWHCAV